LRRNEGYYLCLQRCLVYTDPINTFFFASGTKRSVGNLVKSVINVKSTYLLGKQHQKKVDGASTTVLKYYSSHSAQIAVRTISKNPHPALSQGRGNVVQWMLSDHLPTRYARGCSATSVRKLTARSSVLYQHPLS
jgi:hypothetical protein